MMTPASPWIGSTRKAAVFGVIACSSAAASPNGMILNPGANGQKWVRLSGSVEKPTMPSVRPWKFVGADDDLGVAVRHALHLIAPFAHRLDRAFDRLGAAVHRQ